MKNSLSIILISLFVLTGFKPKSVSSQSSTVFYYYAVADCSCSNDALDYSSKKFHKYFSRIKVGEKVYGSFDFSEAQRNFRNHIIAVYSHCKWNQTVINVRLSDYYGSRDDAADALVVEIANFKIQNPRWEIHD